MDGPPPTARTDPPNAAAVFDQMGVKRNPPSIHHGESLQMSPTSPTHGADVASKNSP